MRQAHIGHQANLVKARREARIFGGHNHITRASDRHARTRRPTFHRSNNGLAALGHQAHQLMGAAHAFAPRQRAINIHGGNIATSAESALSARHHNGADCVITMGAFHHVFHRGAQYGRDGVLAGWAINGDDQHRAIAFFQNALAQGFSGGVHSASSGASAMKRRRCKAAEPN